MKNKMLNQTHKIKLSTISPVSIGDGGRLMPFTDYVLDDGAIVYIDQRKMEACLYKKPELVDQLVENIAYATNVRKNDFLLNFIEDEALLDTSLDALSLHGRIPAYGIDNVTEVQTIVKNAGQPYIPGSTIKGAIKTAILFDWLTADVGAGKEALYRFKEALFDRGANINRVYQEEVEDKLFGKLSGRNRMAYSLFKVSDTNPADAINTLGVYNTDRFNLGFGSAESKLTIIKEAILPKKEFNFKISIADNKVEKIYDTYIRKFKADIFELFDIINYFTLENLYQELDHVRSGIDTKVDEELADYYDFLEERVKEIENYRAGKQNIALLRLGSGKTYYYNSMGLAFVLKFGKSEYRFRQQFRLQPKQDIFPITRTLTKDRMELGWVKIELV